MAPYYRTVPMYAPEPQQPVDHEYEEQQRTDVESTMAWADQIAEEDMARRTITNRWGGLDLPMRTARMMALGFCARILRSRAKAGQQPPKSEREQRAYLLQMRAFVIHPKRVEGDEQALICRASKRIWWVTHERQTPTNEAA